MTVKASFMAHRTLLPIDEDVTRRGVSDARFGTASSVRRTTLRILGDRKRGNLSRQRGNKVG